MRLYRGSISYGEAALFASTLLLLAGNATAGLVAAIPVSSALEIRADPDVTVQEVPGSSGKWPCKGKPAAGQQWESEKADLSALPSVQNIYDDIKTCGIAGLYTVFYSFGASTAEARAWRDKEKPSGVMFNDCLGDDWWKMMEKFKTAPDSTPTPPETRPRQEVLIARICEALAKIAVGEVFLVTGDEVARGKGAYTIPNTPGINHWRQWEFPRVQQAPLTTKVTVINVKTSEGTLSWLPGDKEKYPDLPINNADDLKPKPLPAAAASASSTSQPKSSPTPVKPPPPPTPKCHGLTSNKYLAQAQLATNIKDFCSDAAKQGVQDKDSGSIVRSYQPDTNEAVSLAIDWPPGLQLKDMEKACLQYLNQISDGCDGNDPNNPMNWKGGGTIQVDKALYHIEPQAVRQPFRKSVWAHCDTRYDFLYDSYWIQGAGWANSDTGNSLKSNLNGCAGSDYSFTYKLGTDGSEWNFSGRAPIWKKSCIQNAIKSAGGPSDISCSGNG